MKTAFSWVIIVIIVIAFIIPLIILTSSVSSMKKSVEVIEKQIVDGIVVSIDLI